MRYHDPLHDDATFSPEADPICVLIVDDEPDIREALGDAIRKPNLNIIEAGSISEARRIVDDRCVDLALVDVTLPDGDGLDLAGELHGRATPIQSIVITGKPSMDRAVDAIRAGAADFLPKPLNLVDLNTCVDKALERHTEHAKMADRVERLRRLCKKLNKARIEVTEQVDILCNDLVMAYQELAGQMKHIQLTTEFKTMIDDELDLENLLRRALEFMLHQVGPTNAVVFLPSQMGGYSVGGYINYTFDKTTADVLLSYLSDTAAPRIAEMDEPGFFADDAEINLWLDDESAWLSGCQLVVIPCKHDGETLASIMLFRDRGEEFDEDAVDGLNAVGPIFAKHLVKVIGIHHRHVADDEDEDWGLGYGDYDDGDSGDGWGDGGVPF
ncbi:MAG: response regulator [Planctomycetota bacterium]|jgi:DNA-binding response OmpR family regulator